MQLSAQHYQHGSTLVLCCRCGRVYVFSSGNGKFCGRRSSQMNMRLLFRAAIANFLCGLNEKLT